MTSPSELSLDYKPKSFTLIQNQRPLAEQTEQMQRLQEFLARLEEERLKIEAFKRELPLCMQLLNNAMEAYRRQLQTYQTSQGPRPVLEEFIPLKNMSIEESDKPACTEKATWMVSAQLWSAPPPAEDSSPQRKEATENCFTPISKPRSGGAFHPFSKDKTKDLTSPPPPPLSPPPPPPPSSCSVSTGALLPDLALASIDNDMEDKMSFDVDTGALRGARSSKVGGGDQQLSAKGGGESCNVSGEPAPSTQRKARRCWSPDLHRRFVNALQILGGSQVATPKQIRELMKVDGLTNDEVKSHLQKYRLHTRRPMPAATAAAGPQLVVLGGIWVPPEYATSATVAAGPALYGAHHSAAQFCPPLPLPLPQDYYQTHPPPPPLTSAAMAAKLHGHLQPLYRGAATARYKGCQGSSDSDARERSESIEEVRGREVEEGMEEDEKEVENAIGVTKAEDSGVLLKF